MNEDPRPPNSRNYLAAKALLALNPSILVHIKTLLGKIFHIDVLPNNTILNLKSRIQQQEGVPVNQQTLVFDGRQAENHQTLNSLNIVNGSTLHLVLKLRGDGGGYRRKTRRHRRGKKAKKSKRSRKH